MNSRRVPMLRFVLPPRWPFGFFLLTVLSGILLLCSSPAQIIPGTGGNIPNMRLWTDYRVSLSLRSDGNGALGIMFRYQDGNNYYRFSWDGEQPDRRLVKRANGVFTTLAADAVPYSKGRTYGVVITALGTQLRVFINGQLIFEVSDATCDRGTIALYSRANKDSRFDNIVVDNPDTGAVFFQDNFGDGTLGNWTIVDDGTHLGPSKWTVRSGALVQRTDTYSPRRGAGRLGTYALSKVGRNPVPTNYTVAFIGDTGAGNNFRRVLQLIKSQGTHMILHQGDLGYDADTAQWEGVINEVLGANFPYFATAGNHDRNWAEGYGPLLAARARRVGAACTDNYGLNSTCYYQGLVFILSASGETGSEAHNTRYIKDQLATDHAIWRICAWHRNQHLMQIGRKPDEVGWGPYEACREGGAIVATAHEHTYSRTHLMANFRTQTIASTSNTLQLEKGRSFAVVSALGGRSIRHQELDRPWWASIYTATQDASYGALFCTFNVDGMPNHARCYFMDVNGHVPDRFAVVSAVP